MGSKVRDSGWVDTEPVTAAKVAAPGFNAPGGDGTHFWVAADGTIKTPAGATFVPVGVNSSGSNWVWDEEVLGRAGDMDRWHFNTIRLNCLIRCWTGQPCNNVAGSAAAALPHLSSIVAEYTALGYVVMLTQHTYGATTNSDPSTDAALEDQVTWWSTIAAAFASNPRVWFNPVNEPTANAEFYAPPDRGLTQWMKVARALGDAIDAVAPSSMIVFDGHSNGQEKSHKSCRDNPDFTVAPLGFAAALKRQSELQTRFGRNRVIISSHFYGMWAGTGPGNYETFYPGCVGPGGDPMLHFRADANYYLDQAAALGIPVLFGEWGGREYDAEEWFAAGGLDAAHMLVQDVLPGRTSPKCGAIFWHGSGLDLRYLTTVQGEWWSWDGNAAHLSPQGLAFFNYCAAVNP